MDSENKEEKKKKTSTTKKKSTTTKKTTTKKSTTKKSTVKKEEKVEVVPIPETTPETVPETQPETVPETVPEVVQEAEETPQQILDEVEEVITAPVKDLVNGEFHKKPSSWIYAIVVLFIIFMVLVCVWVYFNPKQPNRNGTFLFVDQQRERIIDEDYLEIEDREQLKKLFPRTNIQGIDFDRYDYVLLSIMYDSCSESDITPVGYQYDKGVLKVQFDYKASCGVCAPEYLYYLLEVPETVIYHDLEIDYHATNKPHCDPNVAYKPIIYFYPEQDTKISVKLGNPDYLTTTYPKYNNGWEYLAKTDGTLQDMETGRTYYGLFWEGNHHPAKVQEDGFVVRGEDTLTFLEEKLSVLGLNDLEANEFIIYWLPKLENNPYNYIRFETKEEINEYMPLEVSPTPDSVIRIQMDYLPLEKEMKVKEQKLVTPERVGFTLVEWGGSIIKD